MSESERERDFHRRWPLIGAPLRPPPQAAAAMAGMIVGREGLALQLGVTPEIALLPPRSVAVDWNAAIVRAAWPGAGDAHRVVIGDWRALPLAEAAVATVIGDGSLTMLSWPEGYRALFAGLAHALALGGRVVLRCFANPAPAEPVAAVRAAAMAGLVGGFSAFKLRFNMAVYAALGEGQVTSQRLLEAFDATFPDRAALARASGWSEARIAEVDAYRGGLSLHSYPSRAEVLATAPWQGRFVETAGYELAERCPLLVIDRPA